MATAILIGVPALSHVGLLPATSLLLEVHLYLGGLRSKPQYLALQLKLSIVPWQLPLASSFGFVLFLLPLGFFIISP